MRKRAPKAVEGALKCKRAPRAIEGTLKRKRAPPKGYRRDADA